MKIRGVKLLVATLVSTMILSSSIVQVKAAEGTYICQEYQQYIYQVTSKYGVSPEIVMAIIERESSGRAYAIDVSGTCHGLMQINVNSHKSRMERLGVKDIYDPYSNILVGVDYLSELSEGQNNIYIILMNYHGESNVSQKVKEGKFSNYSTRIVTRANEIKQASTY